MRMQLLRVIVLGFAAMAMCQGSSCNNEPSLNQPISTNGQVAVTVRNATEGAMYLTLLNEERTASNLIQPGGTRTINANLSDMTIQIFAYQPDNPHYVESITCNISRSVDNTLTATGVEVVWTTSGLECREGS
jgi:uncharacterized protein (UPF0333 family)